jgi:hypothetical protein
MHKAQHNTGGKEPKYKQTKLDTKKIDQAKAPNLQMSQKGHKMYKKRG